MNINRIAEIINERGYEAVVHKVVKGSTVKIGISVGSGTIRPTMYPGDFSLDDFTDEEIAEKIIKLYEQNKCPEVDTDKLTDISYIKENMFLAARRPCNDNAFSKQYLDIELVVRVSLDNLENATFIVNGELAKMLNLDESIFDEAIKNMTFVCKSMFDLISVEDAPDDAEMFVISTPNRLFGAAALYDTEYIASIAHRLDSDLIIIPSSTDEIIVVKYDTSRFSIEDMNEMVVSVNNAEVEAEKQLSDHVYIFHKDTNSLSY